jgi:hypothetical protein
MKGGSKREREKMENVEIVKKIFCCETSDKWMDFW